MILRDTGKGTSKVCGLRGKVEIARVGELHRRTASDRTPRGGVGGQIRSSFREERRNERAVSAIYRKLRVV